MSDRITEELAPVPVLPLMIDVEIPLLDDAIPLVRDEDWTWYAVLYDDPGRPTDLGGRAVTAELRWRSGEQEVTVAPMFDTLSGQVRLSVAAADTHAMPLGQLLKLYLAIDAMTACEPIAVNVLEGRFYPGIPGDGNGNGGNGGGGEVPVVTERVKASLGQSNDLGAGSSDGNHALGGDLYVNQSGGGIWILNESGDFVRAQYGVDPLTFDAPDGSLCANHSISFLNTFRASGIDPPTIPYYYIQSAVGGVSISNFISIKAAGVQMLLTILQDKIIASERDACTVFSIDIGEADSIGDVADSYAGGTVTGNNKFGNQATGLIAGTNPKYPWLDLPQSVIDELVAADGFNTYRGFKAGFEHMVALVRRLRNWKGEPFLKPYTPILICELGEAFPGNESRRNDVFASYAGGADFDPFVYVVPTAGLPLDTSQSGGDFNNANHWLSSSQNIVGKRLFQTYISASRAGRRDINGQNVAPRYWLQVNLNVDHAGISQSVDGAYYELSMDQLRNGLSLRVHASTIFVPNETFIVGSPDLEIRVFSVSGGNTTLACRQELADMPNDLGPIVVGGETIEHSYVLDNIGTWRFSSIERWTLVQPPMIAGYLRGGALSTTVNAFRGYASGIVASGSIVATGTVNGVSFGTVTANFAVSSDSTYTAFAAALQVALNAVSGQSGWVATYAGAGTNLVEITGGTGHIIAVSAFTITGSTGLAGYELTDAQSQSNTAYTVAASAKVLLDNANSASPGRVILLGDPAAGFTLQASQGAIVDKTGAVAFNPITVPAGRSIILEPLTPSRWWVTGGSYFAA